MKIIATLPEAKYYQLDSQTEKGFKLVDKATTAIRNSLLFAIRS